MYRGIKDENSMIGAAIEANLLLEKIDATKKQKRGGPSGDENKGPRKEQKIVCVGNR